MKLVFAVFTIQLHILVANAFMIYNYPHKRVCQGCYSSHVKRNLSPDRLDEIEDLGGDPFFLTDDEEEVEKSTEDEEDDVIMSSTFLSAIASSGEGAISKLGKAEEDKDKGTTSKTTEKDKKKDKKFLWDGNVIEDAHFDD